MSGFPGMNEFDDPFKGQREFLDRILKAVPAMKAAADMSNTELADRMFEIAESGLLPNEYSAACFELGMRTKKANDEEW